MNEVQAVTGGGTRFDTAFRALFEASVVGIGVGDLNGRLVEANPALAGILGYAREELQGKAWAELTHPDDVPTDLHLIAGLIRGDFPHFHRTKRYQRRDGSIIWVRLSLSLFNADDGQKRLVGVVEDASDSHFIRAGQSVGRKARAVSLHAYIPWRWQVGEDALWFGAGLSALLGQGSAETPTCMRELLKFVHRKDRFRIVRTAATAAARQKPCWISRVRIRRTDGTHAWVSCEGQHTYAADGGLLWMSGHLVELSGQRRTEKKAALSASITDLRKSILAEIGQQALADQRPDELMSRVASAAADGLNVPISGVVVPHRRRLRLQTGIGWPESVVGSDLCQLSCAATCTMRSRQPLVVEDVRTDPRLRGCPLTTMGAVSALGVGIQAEGRPFGVLLVLHKSHHSFTDTEVGFLQALASMLSVSILRQRMEQSRRSLLHRVMSLQQEERRRIARELHDEAGQSLTGLLVGLRAIMDSRRLTDARQTAVRLREMAVGMLENIGRLARGLHPGILDDLGLSVALERYAAEYSTHFGIAVQTRVSGSSPDALPNQVQLTLYRIMQEALTNVARHSGADRVEVELAIEHPRLRMSIRDNGAGFCPGDFEHDTDHLGIAGMKERAALLGGELSIVSSPQGGSSVVVEIPQDLEASSGAETRERHFHIDYALPGSSSPGAAPGGA